MKFALAAPKKSGSVKQRDRHLKRKQMAERRAKAFELMSRGATLEMIVAADIGYSTPGMVSQDLKRWREETVQRGVDEFREKQVAILERLLQEFAVPIGQVESREDKLMDLQRGKLAVQILERLAKTLGTDAPVRIQSENLSLEVSVAKQMTDTEIREFIETGMLPPRLRLLDGGKAGDGGPPASAA